MAKSKLLVNGAFSFNSIPYITQHHRLVLDMSSVEDPPDVGYASVGMGVASGYVRPTSPASPTVAAMVAAAHRHPGGTVSENDDEESESEGTVCHNIVIDQALIEPLN